MARKKEKLLLGVDLGGTKMLMGLLKANGGILATKKVKVDTGSGKKNFLKMFKATADELFEECGETPKRLAGVGIGCPGIIDHSKGSVRMSPNIPFLKNFEFARKVKQIFGVPVVVENDANAGLYGEKVFGAARGWQHVIGVFLGTGVGGALILNGTLYRGATGAAGEIGHMIVQPEGSLCGCGQRGCLEVYSGRVGIAAEAAILAHRREAPALFKETGTEVSRIKSGALASAIRGATGDLKR